VTNAVNKLQDCDVAIVGGGPAGLSAAVTLRRNGVDRVVVLERESNAGGIPRHCLHSPFGMREFSRLLNGPAYARRMVREALATGVDVRTNVNVVGLHAGGRIDVATPDGCYSLVADRVVLATGGREMPRSARLISGTRPLGVTNTGALQSMVHLKNQLPFAKPVIVGTELVSFSSLLTCRKAGIQPIAMLEENSRITAKQPSQLLARGLGIPIHYQTRLLAIEGGRRVERVIVADHNGVEQSLQCDGVLLTGRFTPESSLARMAHLEIDPASGGPVIDQHGRCSDPAFYAAGNVLRAVETAGWCYREGGKIGKRIADDLAGVLPDRENEFTVAASGSVKYVVPQRIAVTDRAKSGDCFQLRFDHQAKGRLVAKSGGKTVWSKSMTVLPERRVLVPVPPLGLEGRSSRLEFLFEENKN